MRAVRRFWTSDLLLGTDSNLRCSSSQGPEAFPETLYWRNSTTTYARRASILQVSTAVHGFQHGDFVGKFQVRANRNTDANSCDPDTERLDQLGYICRRGFALSRRIGRQDNFFDAPSFE